MKHQASAQFAKKSEVEQDWLLVDAPHELTDSNEGSKRTKSASDEDHQLRKT